MFKRLPVFFVIALVVFSILTAPSAALASSGGQYAELKGTLAAVDTSASTVTITPKKGGSDVTLTVDANTLIKRNSRTATLADLQVGDKVEAKYDPATMLAFKIKAKFKVSELKGIIVAVDTSASTVTITPKKGGTDVTLNVDANTSIKRKGPATLADLQIGDKIEAKYDPAAMLAIKIEAKPNLAKVKGTIAAIDTAAGTLTITPKNGSPDVTLTVDANTYIKRNGQPATLADLLVGDRVEAKYNPATMLAASIKASNLLEVKGSIAAVDTTAGTVTITPSDGSGDVTLTVDANTRIERYDAPATLADLLVGDPVEAKYDPTTMLAVKIEVE
jgi:cold shock CspA family protein/phage terminase large subunit-like protein